MNNSFEVRGEVTAIFINRKDGQILETLIDTEDLEMINSYTNTWKITSDGKIDYIGVHLPRKDNKRRFVRMHRVIMNAPNDLVVDHINHNTLDNRKSNLRIITRGENSQNRKGAQSNSKSGVRGIYKTKYSWKAQYKINGKQVHVGSFKTKEDAEKAIIEARKKVMPFSNEGENN